MNALWRRARLVGYQLDCLLNAAFLPAAQEDQSVSVNASLHQHSTGWGCILCHVLSALVQRDHCARVRADAPMPALDAIRAGVSMLAFLALIYGAISVLTNML